MSQYLSEAFKKLDTLNEETFSVTDSGLQDFVKFTEDDEDENIIDIIDVEAETNEDLEDSYIGKVILDCCVCHSKLYKDTEDVVIEDDLANVGEECPFCYANDGYKVVGQVAAFDEDDEDKEEEDTEEESEETKEDEEDDEESEELDEGILDTKTKAKDKSKSIKESDDPEDFRTWLDEPLSSYADPSSLFGKQEATLDFIENTGKQFGIEFMFGRTIGKEPQTVIVDYLKNDNMVYVYSNGTCKINGVQIGDPFDSVEDVDIDDLKDDIVRAIKSIKDESKAINEDINNLSLDTDDTHMEMTSDENGKVTITTEPVGNEKIDENETIAPVEPEVQNEIESNVADGEEIEIDVDEFDEESFDELSEGYLKKVYENVDSFKTSKVSYNDNELILEGVIKFNSGKAKKTTFLFENKLITKKGKVRFIGENKEIARGKKSFTITGRIDNKKFLSESFNYNYGVKTPLGKVKRLYGTINK